MRDWLTHQARAHPLRVALIWEDTRWTYAELNAKVTRLADRLAARGIRPGDHVAVHMPNSPEYVFLIHALASLEAVLVPLNIRLTPEELQWQMEHARCGFLVERRCATGDLQVASSERRVPPSTPCPSSLDTLQSIVFTSGTTGRPKGAMLTFANHFWNAVASASRLGVDPHDRWLLCMPLYHVGGMAIVLRSCLYGTAVVLHPRFDPVAVNEALDTQEITLVSLVPTMLHRLLEARGERPMPPTLRCILLGGAAAPPALREKCLALNLPVATTYGLTETASQVATATPAEVRRKPGTVGKPLPFTEVRVVGEDGCELPAGEIGEIAVRGPTVMRGYYQRAAGRALSTLSGQLPTLDAENRKLTARSGFCTGDLGYLDADGDLWVVQRRTDLIVTGGENVYPAEVEQVLLVHPDVQEACVVGVDDAEWGQRVAAAVVVKEGAPLTEEELTAFCRKRLARYKMPHIVHFMDALPQTASGKVWREAVRKALSEEAAH
jgi:O-succinylbenzoic acid--CoA ligase